MASPTSFLGIFDIDRRSVRPTETAGAPGFAIYNGFIQSTEKSARMRGPERYREFSDLLTNVSIVAAGCRYFLNLVHRAAWKVEPAEVPARQKPEAERYAELVDEIIRDMDTPWGRVVRRMAMHRFYGFSIQEWIAKRRDDGILGLRDVAPRPQHTIQRWDVDDEGRVLGVAQINPQTQREAYLPRAKLVYAVDDSLADSPEGLGLFRHLIEPADRLRQYQKLEGIGFETNLRGIPIGRAPVKELLRMQESGELGDDGAAKLQAMIQPLEDFMRNHIRGRETGMLFDSDVYRGGGDQETPINIYQWGLELLTGGDQGQREVAAAIERLNREMARIIGVEGLLLGGEKVGSMALSKDKSNSFGLIIDSTLTECEETVETDLVYMLFRINGWPLEYQPTLKTEPVQYRAIEEVTAALVDLATAGAPLQPDDPVQNQVRDLLGLKRVDLDLLASRSMATGEGRGDPTGSGAEPPAAGGAGSEDEEKEERVETETG